MQITKQTVTAKTRQLSAKWTLEAASEPQVKKSKPYPSAEQQQYVVTTAMRDWYLENHGIKVPVFTHDDAELTEWCHHNCKKLWSFGMESKLIDMDELKERLFPICGVEDNRDVEDMITNALARDLSREIDRELLGQLGVSIPRANYWFEDANEAMLFKLTWGGE